ncbi:Lipocalin-like domain-containing protein [Aspergillus spectabilis]
MVNCSLPVALQSLLAYTAGNGHAVMTSSPVKNLRSELVGTWELVDHVAYPRHNRTDKHYPMGHNAKAIITYSPDGYMSAQFHLPGQQVLDGTSESDHRLIGNASFMAYAGEFYLEESTENSPLVIHRPRITNVPHILDQLQRRSIKILDEDGWKYLYLSTVEPMKVSGVDSTMEVKWRKFPENTACTMETAGGNQE